MHSFCNQLPGARSKLRVAMVIPRYYPIFGGAENQCRSLCRALLTSQSVHVVWILTKRVVGKWPRSELVDSIQIRRLGFSGVNRWTEYWFYICVAVNLVNRRREYDVIHCHASALAGFVVAVAGRLVGKPVALKLSSSGELLNTAHRGTNTNGIVRRWITKAKLGLARITGGWSHFIALTEEGLDELGQISARSRTLIPNGVDTSLFCPASKTQRSSLRQSFGFDRDSYVILFTGRFVRGKGLDILLNGLDLLRFKSPALFKGVRICLVGSDENQDNSMSSLIHQVQAAYTGLIYQYAPRNPPIDFLQASDLFVFPSRQEGMPNSVLEAISVGLPCILSDIRPHKELAARNPRAVVQFFSSDDAHDLARQLELAIVRRLSSDHESHLAGPFDLAQVAVDYEDFYRRLMLSSTANYCSPNEEKS